MYKQLVNTNVTSHAKMFLTASRFETDSRTEAVHQPFERDGMPFEWLKLSVQKNRQPFERLKLSVQKNRQPFERLELSVQKNCQPFERLELSVQ